MSFIIDHLDTIEAAVPELRHRMDHSKVAVVGHSMGGHTARLLLGARLIDPSDDTEVKFFEPRIKAGVLLAAPGRGGEALSEFAPSTTRFLQRRIFPRWRLPRLSSPATTTGLNI